MCLFLDPDLLPSVYSEDKTHLKTVHRRYHHDKVIREEATAPVQLSLPPAFILCFLQTQITVTLLWTLRHGSTTADWSVNGQPENR